MTNFSAVCVSENRTTFTSTRPAACPAFITSDSETWASLRADRPERTVALHASGQLGEFVQRRARFDCAEDDIRRTSARDPGAALLQFHDEVGVGHPDEQHGVARLHAQLFDS